MNTKRKFDRERISHTQAFRIALRDNFTCRFCGSRPGNDLIEIDHLIPVCHGGSDADENLVAACKKCNRGKSSAVCFPASMIEGVDSRDPDWMVHRSFGAWQVKVHFGGSVVLEFTPYGYWIPLHRAHEPDWVPHIMSKEWGPPHSNSDFIAAVSYLRMLAACKTKQTQRSLIKDGDE